MVEQNCMFHLRRVQFQTFVKEKGGRPLTESINDGLEEAKESSVLGRSTMILLDKQTKIGRNPELVDVVLHSVVHSNMISRDHSEIIGELDNEKDGHFVKYFISDRSLNGTYVNDTRVKDLQQLKEGDLIKFGHVNGAAIKPGEFAPQQSAEFIFRFERALPNYNYFGYNSKGIRIQGEHRRAYMQINSDRVLPTEVYSSSTLAGQKLSIGAPGPAGLVNNNTNVNNNGGMATAVNSSGAQIPSLPSSAVTSIANLNSTSTAALPTPTHPNPPTNQLAHLAAVAAATTQNANAGSIPSNLNSATSSTAQQSVQQQSGATQHQQTLNALNQLGLGATTTEEQVAAMNAQLRSLMASHDAMSAMERLAAHQQWQKSLLNLNSLQQQNPLIYGHAFPAAAAAAAALFTGIGGIDLNSAATNPTAAQYAAAASLWPNIRATLQPSAANAQDWSQQQKAAAIAQQLQLRLPGNLYQSQQQSNSNARAAVAASAVTVASSLFGASSAFSLPASHPQNQTTNNTSSNNNVAGLLIAAQHSGQQLPSTSSSSSSAAYSSCTSSNSQPPGIRPAPLSRGASSNSIGTNLVPTTTDQALNAAAAQLAAARQLAKEALEVDQAKGWPSIGISCTSASANGNSNANSAGQNMSPIVAAAAAAARMPGSAFQGTPPAVSSGQLQRIPGIASALAAAMAAAQQQANGGNATVWQTTNNNNNGTPPVIPTPTPSATPANLVPLSTPPAQQPLAQRLLSSSNSSLSLISGTSKSSSGVSSLQSPNALLISGKNEPNNCNNFRDSLSSTSACTSALNISGTSSAFSTPAQQNSTNLSTLTAAMFAAEEAAKRQSAEEKQQQQQMIGQRRASTGGELAQKEINNTKGREKGIKTTMASTVKSESIRPKSGSTNGPISIAADLNQLQIENKNGAEESKNGGRQLMECDSSVPSPPSKQQDEEMLPRPSSSMMMKEEEGEGEDCKADPISRKRHSDSGDGNMDKPRPMKQPRKSNEVARLLNDLTAGNCSWQYMAEKQQQRVTTSTKNKAMNSKDDKVTNKAGKKPLRLDERKQLEIEKKKTHKMMRQISDSESSIDEQPQDDDGSGKVKNSIVADSEDDTKSGKKIAKEKLLKRKTMRYNRSTSSASSDSIPTFNFDESDRKKKSFSADSDSDNERPSRKGGKPPATNKNGNLLNGGTSSTGIAAGKRKLLSSAPTKKPTAIESKLVNGHNNGTTTETNGKKRGPKPVEEKKGPGRTRKNTVGSTNSSVAASTRSAAGGKKKAENGKPGRKAGTTNGRGKKNAAASDNEDDEEKNNNSDAESDLGDVRPVTKPMNGGTVVKGKRGRKAGTGKKQLAAETDTVMEDWTGGKGDPEKCAHEECKRPKEMSINWVQCDDCDGWFHSICVFGKNTMPKEEDKWYCVACQPNHGNSSISLDEAASTSNNSTLHT